MDRLGTSKSANIVAAIAPLIGVIALWQVAYTLQWVRHEDLPSPAEAIASLQNDLLHPISRDEDGLRPLIFHCGLTLARWLIAFLCSVFVGCAVGLALGMSRPWFRAGYPLSNFLRCMPSSILLPLFASFVGYKPATQLVVAIYGSLWPVLLATAMAVANVRQEVKDSIAFMHLEKWRATWITFKYCWPQVFAGIEISSAVAFLLVITVELIYPGNGGLGWYLYTEHNDGHRRLLAGALVIALIGFVLNQGVHLVKKKVVTWEEESLEAGVETAKPVKLHKLSVQGHARKILDADRVTDELVGLFGSVELTVLYSRQPPYKLPDDTRKLPVSPSGLIQRDIKLACPQSAGHGSLPVLFARSWIAGDRLTDTARSELDGQKKTLGHIIRDMTRSTGQSASFVNLSYRTMVSDLLAGPLGAQGPIEVIERARMILIDNQPIALIHEYVPLSLFRQSPVEPPCLAT